MFKTMKQIFTFIVFWPLFTQAQTIGNFISLDPIAQQENLILPPTHTFQVLFQAGDVINGYSLPGLFDFTGYVPISGSSTIGYLSLNHENASGGVTHFDVQRNIPSAPTWQASNATPINFIPQGGTYRLCSGTVTPWSTVISGEESLISTDNNGDGYLDGGWLVETNPVAKTFVRKIYKAGRGIHENCVINASQTALYTSNDDANYGFIFKYVFTTPGYDSVGSLFAFQKNTATGGIWLPIANATPNDCNNVYLNAQTAGATNFYGVEDVELSANGTIYFGSKYTGNIYKMEDVGNAVQNFDTFVVNTNYMVNTSTGPTLVNWGTGIDNLAFDNEGNLWALQDGGNNYIWMIGSQHTKSNPQIHLFGIVPAGAEPTGITFTPDNKYLFMSIQHPDGGNTLQQADALNKQVIFNRDAAIVIARVENLGAQNPFNTSLQISFNNSTLNSICATEENINWQGSNDVVFTKFDDQKKCIISPQKYAAVRAQSNTNNAYSNILFIEKTTPIIEQDAILFNTETACTIFDLNGSTLLQEKAKKINISRLASGIYILKTNEYVIKLVR